MKIFGQLIRTAINVATLPIDIAVDVVKAPIDAIEKGRVGDNTRDKIEKIKDEAAED